MNSTTLYRNPGSQPSEKVGSNNEDVKEMIDRIVYANDDHYSEDDSKQQWPLHRSNTICRPFLQHMRHRHHTGLRVIWSHQHRSKCSSTSQPYMEPPDHLLFLIQVSTYQPHPAAYSAHSSASSPSSAHPTPSGHASYCPDFPSSLPLRPHDLALDG